MKHKTLATIIFVIAGFTVAILKQDIVMGMVGIILGFIVPALIPIE